MKPFEILTVAFTLLASNPAISSGFESCDFEAQVQTAREQPKGTYALTVHVANVARAKDEGDSGYSDCPAYAGKDIQVTFAVSEFSSSPVAGDTISFSRSARDGFNESGAYVGTTVTTQLHRLRKPSVAGGR